MSAEQQSAKPVVYAFCTGYVFGDQQWIAVTADGQVLAGHISSSAWWGQRDVGPDGFAARRQHYVDTLGTADVDYRVVPVGELPPPEVLAAMEARAAAAERAAELDEMAAAANAHVRGEPDPSGEDDRG